MWRGGYPKHKRESFEPDDSELVTALDTIGVGPLPLTAGGTDVLTIPEYVTTQRASHNGLELTGLDEEGQLVLQALARALRVILDLFEREVIVRPGKGERLLIGVGGMDLCIYDDVLWNGLLTGKDPTAQVLDGTQ